MFCQKPETCSWLGKAEVEGHDQAHLLCLFWEVAIWTTAPRCSLQLLMPLLIIFFLGRLHMFQSKITIKKIFTV